MAEIHLTPQRMSPTLMQQLEDEGLIIRMAPGHHRPATPEGTTVGESLYECDAQYGPHKLIIVSVNRTVFAEFGTHPDIEDVLLIGDPSAKPMTILFARDERAAIEQKVQRGSLSADDFIALQATYNDPQVSFFSIKADIAHGEAVAPGPGTPATFYVTESRDLPLRRLEIEPFTFRVD